MKMKIVSVLLIVFMLFSTVTIVNSIEVNNGYYIVRQGDTLTSVADKFGVSEKNLLDWNNLASASSIFAGKLLKISDKQSTYKPVDVPVTQGSVSINFVDTDIRDVLSAVAIELGSDILYIGSSMRFSIRAASISRADLLDVVVSTAGGMAWVNVGDLVVVGPKEKITSDFLQMTVFTGIRLKYITAPEVDTQIKALKINVSTVILPNSLNKIWVQGLPGDISRTYKMITTLDKKENFPELTKGTANVRNTYMSLYDLKYVQSKLISSVVSEMGLEIAFGSPDDNPSICYASGTSEEMAKFEGILKQVDVPKNTQNPETGEITGISKYLLKYISYSDAVNLLSHSKLGITVMDVISFPKTVFFFGPKNLRDEALRLLKSVDNKGELVKEIVDYASDRGKLAARRNLICQISGLPVDNFVISEDVDRATATKFILYYTGIEAEIAEIRYIVKEIDSPLGGS